MSHSAKDQYISPTYLDSLIRAKKVKVPKDGFSEYVTAGELDYLYARKRPAVWVNPKTLLPKKVMRMGVVPYLDVEDLPIVTKPRKRRRGAKGLPKRDAAPKGKTKKVEAAFNDYYSFRYAPYRDLKLCERCENRSKHIRSQFVEVRKGVFVCSACAEFQTLPPLEPQAFASTRVRWARALKRTGPPKFPVETRYRGYTRTPPSTPPGASVTSPRDKCASPCTSASWSPPSSS